MQRVYRFAAGFLAVLVIFSALPVNAQAFRHPFMPDSFFHPNFTPDTSLPAESVPEESVPEESLPEESVPEESVPDESIPDESISEESVPDESIPEESVPEESVPEETLPSVIAEPDDAAEPRLYFGLLNGHSSISEGSATSEEMFRLAEQIPNMDFFAIADHSDSFDNHSEGSIETDGSTVSADWLSGKTAALAASTDAFAAMFGYEMNWPAQMKLGHISTFGTAGFQSWTQTPYATYDGALENYYQTLASAVNSVSQFNHPGKQYGTFNNFTPYSEEADRVITLLELDFSEATPLRYYTKALDQGWHLAPTARQSVFGTDWRDTGVRTAVYAQSLRGSHILDAFRNCRAYATEDPDLAILYSMDGYFMGSQLDLQHIGETADVSVTLHDPTDNAIGLVEIITNDSLVTAQQTLDAASGTLTFSLPPEAGYYFLRITQPDGDLAVTAPIWVDAGADLGITDFFCETSVPVRNEPVSLTLVLHNRETVDFLVESVELLADDSCVTTASSLTCVPADSSLPHEMTVSFDCAGLTQITARVKGTLSGSQHIFEASVDLNFRQSDQVTAILVDGSHGNAGLEELNILRQMAMDENIRLTVADAGISPDLLEDCRFLLVTAPSQPFSDDFLAAAAEFSGFGGSIVLCGQSAEKDADVSGAAELNRLLSAIGSSLGIYSDTVLDPVTNNGSSDLLNSDEINLSLDWCAGISPNQVYRVSSGATVSAGNGTAIVTGRSTTVSSSGSSGGVALMACEPLSGGGTVFAAGSLFLADENMEEAKNIWDEPYANRLIAGNLLGIGGPVTPLSTIALARAGAKSQLFRIQGYVTAGNSNPYNTFPDTLYLQDETGGIAVTPFPDTSIQQGTPVEITGYAGSKNGNRILKLSSWRILEDPMYQYQPLTGSWDTLLDQDANGGRLIQVEGTCQEIYCREDDTLSGCLLTDSQGNKITVTVEDRIFNGSDGGNELHKSIRRNRTVRAMGLLHVDDYGNAVIRVRNCEEVVYVPPLKVLTTNPKTRDRFLPVACSLAVLSLAGLLLLKRRKKA